MGFETKRGAEEGEVAWAGKISGNNNGNSLIEFICGYARRAFGRCQLSLAPTAKIPLRIRNSYATIDEA